MSDKIAYDNQHIWSTFVRNALQKLREANLFYSNVVVDSSWVGVNEQSDPTLWNLLTNEIDNVEYETDSYKEIEGNSVAKQNEQPVANVHPTAMHNLDGPNIDPNQIVPAEDQIHLFHVKNQIMKD